MLSNVHLQVLIANIVVGNNVFITCTREMFVYGMKSAGNNCYRYTPRLFHFVKLFSTVYDFAIFETSNLNLQWLYGNSLLSEQWFETPDIILGKVPTVKFGHLVDSRLLSDTCNLVYNICTINMFVNNTIQYLVFPTTATYAKLCT